MTTQHTITAKIPVMFSFPGLAEGERERATITVDIVFTATHDTDSPELMLVSATLIDGDGLDPTDAQVRDWSDTWLDDEGYDAACAIAEAVAA